ncbi:MAG TPA: hypothetical protein P5279_15960 [Anaerohalosphaeraceae bacterium]|jgi:hypothetical protein|nr:hypothetical protein [Anaerohalosphaeraceae bacterium]HRT51984.1 hypothetical protein [Anaerohalosphaeraceae bacterium]HRT87987.1 hypothetical protein [Anaerohalosphaeraceae bacterium]
MRYAIVLSAAGVWSGSAGGSGLEIPRDRGGLDETTRRAAQARLERESLRGMPYPKYGGRGMLDVVP